MKKYLLLFISLISLTASAQIYSDGTVITSFSATDINNDVFSSTITTNAGKHFIIDFSATWCGNCWTYHNSKALNNYNDAYGPSGTLVQDAEVLFYEGDAATNTNDLNGVGTNTVGDWVTGTNHKIFNEATPSIVKSSFAVNGGLGYPTVFLVCSDNKMYRLSTSLKTAAAIRGFVDTKCGTSPLSASTVYSSNFSYDVYPNPTAGNLNIALNLDRRSDIAYDVYSSVGQKIITKKLVNQEGATTLELETAVLPSGMYILNISVGVEKVTEKIIVE